MSKPNRFRCLIEPLESRIAPALLINGANLLGGPNSPKTGETSVGGNSVTIVQVLSGEAIVWFNGNDPTHPGGVIESISFAPNTSLVITGDVAGDIVGNLLPTGRLSDTDHNPLNGEDGGVLLPNNLIGLKVQPLSPEEGSVGNIITGGSVSNVNIAGQINGIYAGDGVFHTLSVLDNAGTVTSAVNGLDFNPLDTSEHSFVFTQRPGLEPTASISNITINKAVNFQAIAGSGNPNHLVLTTGAGQAGGSISNFSVQQAIVQVPPQATSAPPSYELIAGDGGSGAKGGVGGTVNNVVEVSSSGQVLIQAGAGGDGSKGAGGTGGSVTNLDLQSSSSQYTVHAGNGGTGAPGGAGGAAMSNSFANNTPAGGVILASDFTGDGADDILIADQGTGSMVLEQNNGSGTGFSAIVQSSTNTPPTLIVPPSGDETPIAAAAVASFVGDALPDLLVAYQGSDNLVYYHNQGTLIQGSNPAQYTNAGVFWNPALNSGAGDFDTLTINLSFSPSEMAVLNGSGTEIALASNAGGKTTIHLVTESVGNTPSEVAGSTTLPAPCVGLVSTQDGTVFAALSNGSIYALTALGILNDPFSTPSLQSTKVVGGISQFDVDSAGTHLLALAANGKTLQTFNEGGGFLTAGPSISLANLGAVPDVAHFFTNGASEEIALLSSKPTGAQVNLYTLSLNNGVISGEAPQTPPLTTDNSLHNFTVVNSGTSGPGFAGLQGSLGQFTFDLSFTSTFRNFALPFASKTVNITAGDGGNGIDLSSTQFGNGGAGGNISGINADAHDLTLTSGTGGDAEHGGGGAGGSFTNPKEIHTHGSGTVAAVLTGDESIAIQGGDGGSPIDLGGKQASGGAGGSVGGFSISLDAGQNDLLLSLIAGDGGTGKGGAGGAGGSVTNISATGHDGGLFVQAGTGGDAQQGASSAFGNGGSGGAISGINYTLTLDAEAAAVEKPHSATLLTGDGGTSVAGLGGAGGNLGSVDLQMQAANRNDGTGLDSTVSADIETGHGSQGLTGGNGGSITNFQYTTQITQGGGTQGIIVPFAALSIVAGDGGKGTAGNGGSGGSITLTKPISGVTAYDPDAIAPPNNPNFVPLIVTGGTGGTGTAKGGAGGGISGLTVQNSAFSDGTVIEGSQLSGGIVTGGDGGAGGTSDGGAGGSVTNSLIGVQISEDAGNGGFLDVFGGGGGQGGTAGAATAPKAKGGAGGSVTQGEFGLVSTSVDVGMLIFGGVGGDGNAAGGLGGAISGLRLDISQNSTTVEVPAVFLIAGDGGAAHSGAGVGGQGGSISQLSEFKDENSAINLIQAGNGGDNTQGKAGNGGNVFNIHTVGFIGRPSDSTGSLGVFDTTGGPNPVTFAQGLYSGRGGTGATDGTSGSIINIIARQIAAMSAAEDTATQTFEAASKISNVTADLIGYDFYRGTGNAHEGHYTDSTGGDSSPSTVAPLDGFILGTVITNVTGEQTGFVFTS